jgi:zinc transporter ZupT
VDATLLVLTVSSATAAAAAIGALPLASGRPLPTPFLGWATALASGLMLGVAYALMTVGLDRAATASGLGALAGIAGIAAARAAVDPANTLRLGAVHAVPEGVAIGVAMAVGTPFGLFMAAALGVHNVPEGTVTAAALSARGRRLPQAAWLSVAANLNQILFAVIAFVAVTAFPAVLPWALGFAVGAMLHLVMAELLPDAYRHAGRTGIALVTTVAIAIVVLLHDGTP